MLSDFWKCTKLLYSIYKAFTNETSETIKQLEARSKECGVIGTKLMQFLFMHDGFFSHECKQRFMHVFDQCEVHDWKYTADTYERTFGNDIHDDFDITKHDKMPIGSGSIGQVYKLYHRRRKEYVALKIKHPFVDYDASVFVRNVSRIMYFTSFFVKIPFALFIQEFLNNIELQLNYANEATNTMQLRKNFEDESHIIVPEVFSFNENIIIMSYHEGVPFNEIKDTMLRNRVSTDLYLFMVSSLINFDFIHCDMHYGNWKVLVDDNQDYNIVIYDCGIIGRSKKGAEINKNIVLATFKGDFHEIIDVIVPAYSEQPGGKKLLNHLNEMRSKKYACSSDKFAEFVHMALHFDVTIDADVLRCVQGIVTCMSVISISTDRLVKLLGHPGNCMEVITCYNYLLVQKLGKYRALQEVIKQWMDSDPSIEEHFLSWLDNEYGHKDSSVFIDVITSSQFGQKMCFTK